MLRNLVITIGSKGSSSGGMDFDFFDGDEYENHKSRKNLVRRFLNASIIVPWRDWGHVYRWKVYSCWKSQASFAERHCRINEICKFFMLNIEDLGHRKSWNVHIGGSWAREFSNNTNNSLENWINRRGLSRWMFQEHRNACWEICNNHRISDLI